MDVGPFDLWTVPLGRRIVDDRQKPIRQRQGPKHQNQQLGGDGFALASECRQEVKIVLVIVADSGGPEPGRHGSSPVGEEDAHQQDRQSPAVAGVQPRRQPLAPLGPIVRTLPIMLSPSLALPSFASWKTHCDGRAFFIARPISSHKRPTAVFSESAEPDQPDSFPQNEEANVNLSPTTVVLSAELFEEDSSFLWAHAKLLASRMASQPWSAML